ncbi:hypothetical protein [Paenibacillus tyrfis]|uniref:hypothetical protein n=1 Tax=Paenibacillus tyrfis TaxID=1501230 RepID=UPI00209E1BBB|nr:hypothetical protein [Paenibacillus tyrfis]MCP1312102.1 hypothetical protein [Paenibacillus tyrfis]
MDRYQAIAMAYQIATLTYPSQQVMELLLPLPYERTLDLMLILRQSPRPVNSPLNFLRRAIEENWTSETMPEKINRRVQNYEERFYAKQGYSPEEARDIARNNRQDL